jgi:hypothetical protein
MIPGKKKPSREELLAVIDGEVHAVERGDMEDWLKYFARGALLEDPIGSGPFTGKGGDGDIYLARFFQAFVGATTFRYVSKQDFAVGMEVTRDVQVSVLMSTGIMPVVDVHVLYKMVIEDGKIKIAHIKAHWPFSVMIVTFMHAPLLKAMKEGGRFFLRMIEVLGVKDTYKYFHAAFTGIKNKGVKTVEKFADLTNSRDGDGLAKLLDGNGQCIKFPSGSKTLNPEEFFGEIGQKAKLIVKDVRWAHWTTTSLFDMSGAGPDKHGIAIFDFNKKTKKINSAAFYWED